MLLFFQKSFVLLFVLMEKTCSIIIKYVETLNIVICSKFWSKNYTKLYSCILFTTVYYCLEYETKLDIVESGVCSPIGWIFMYSLFHVALIRCGGCLWTKNDCSWFESCYSRETWLLMFMYMYRMSSVNVGYWNRLF